MAAPIRPASTKAYGREKWTFVATIASATLAPAVAEVNAASSLDVSCTLFDSSGRPSQSTNLVTKQKRVCDTTQYQQVGDTTVAGGEIRYAIDTQATAGSDAKKTYEKFAEGTTGFMVQRLGIPVATDIAAGQFVTVYPVEFGPALPGKEGDGESAEVGIVQTMAVTGPPARLIAVLA